MNTNQAFNSFVTIKLADAAQLLVDLYKAGMVFDASQEGDRLIIRIKGYNSP